MANQMINQAIALVPTRSQVILSKGGTGFMLLNLALLLYEQVHVAQRTFESQPHKLAACPHTGLAEKPPQDVLDGTFRNTDVLGDVFVLEAPRMPSNTFCSRPSNALPDLRSAIGAWFRH